MIKNNYRLQEVRGWWKFVFSLIFSWYFFARWLISVKTASLFQPTSLAAHRLLNTGEQRPSDQRPMPLQHAQNLFKSRTAQEWRRWRTEYGEQLNGTQNSPKRPPWVSVSQEVMSRSCSSSYLLHVALFNFLICHGLSSLLLVTLLLFTCHSPPSLLHATLLLVLDMSRPYLSLSCHAHALRHVTDLALFMSRYRVCVHRHAIKIK